jgi:hypothetical protein
MTAMRSTLFACTALLALAACSDSPTGTDDTGILASRISSDVATVSADATAEDVDVMAGLNGLNGNFTVNLLDGMTPPIGPGNVTGCGFGGGRFSCPPNSANGLTITRTVAFYDGQNAVQQAYDALLTAKIEVAATLQGDVTRGPWTATISRTRNFVHTGLLGTETSRTTNGTATGAASRSRINEAGNNRSYDMAETATFVDVVVPVRAEGVAPWPTSGTVTRVITVTPEGGTPVTRTVIINFNGTATPTATVNGEAFTLNLGNRTAQRRPNG